MCNSISRYNIIEHKETCIKKILVILFGSYFQHHLLENSRVIQNFFMENMYYGRSALWISDSAVLSRIFRVNQLYIVNSLVLTGYTNKDKKLNSLFPNLYI